MSQTLVARFAPSIIPTPESLKDRRESLSSHIDDALAAIEDLRGRIRDRSGRARSLKIDLEAEERKLDTLRDHFDNDRVEDFETAIVVENPTRRTGKLVVRLWELDSFLDTRAARPDYATDQAHATVTAGAGGSFVQEGTGGRLSEDPSRKTKHDFIAAFEGELTAEGFRCDELVLPDVYEKGKRRPRLRVRVPGRAEPYELYVQRDELEEEGRYLELGLELELDGEVVYSTKGSKEVAPAFVDLERWTSYNRVVARGLEEARRLAREQESRESLEVGDIVVRIDPNIIPSPAQRDARMDKLQERLDDLDRQLSTRRARARRLTRACAAARGPEEREECVADVMDNAAAIDTLLWERRRESEKLAGPLLDSFSARLHIDNPKGHEGALSIKLYELDTFEDGRARAPDYATDQPDAVVAGKTVREGGKDDFLAVFRGTLQADGSFACDDFQLAKEEQPDRHLIGAPRLKIRLPGDTKRYELPLEGDPDENEGRFLELGLTAELGTQLAYSTLAGSGVAPAFIDLGAWTKLDGWAHNRLGQKKKGSDAPLEDDETDTRALPNPAEINNRALRLITIPKPVGAQRFRFTPESKDGAEPTDYATEMGSAADYAVADLLGKYYPRYNPGALRKRMIVEHQMLGLTVSSYPGGGRAYVRDVFNSFYVIVHTSVEDIWEEERDGSSYVHAKVRLERVCMTDEGEAQWLNNQTGEKLPRGEWPPEVASCDWTMIDTGQLYESFTGQSFVTLAPELRPRVDGSTERGILRARKDADHDPIWARRAVEKAALEAVGQLLAALRTVALPDLLKIRGMGRVDDSGAADIPAPGSTSNRELRLIEILDKDTAQQLRYLPNPRSASRDAVLADLHGLVADSLADQLGKHYRRYDFGALVKSRVVESQFLHVRLDDHPGGAAGFFQDLANQVHIILGYGIEDIWTEERDGDKFLHARVYLRRVCMTAFDPEKVRMIDLCSGQATRDWTSATAMVKLLPLTVLSSASRSSDGGWLTTSPPPLPSSPSPSSLPPSVPASMRLPSVVSSSQPA